MGGLGGEADAAAWGEISAHYGLARVHGANDVAEDAVDDFLVEGLVVAEGGEVKFQRFRLDAGFAGDVADLNARGIGLAGDGAERGKFGKIKMHPVVSLWAAVGKCLKFGLIGRLRPGGLGVAQECERIAHGDRVAGGRRDFNAKGWVRKNQRYHFFSTVSRGRLCRVRVMVSRLRMSVTWVAWTAMEATNCR